MKQAPQPQKEDFDLFLNWLSPNPEQAGKEYERIRQGLLRFYDFRGCSDLEFLADEVINRVIWKFSDLDLNKNVKKITIFYKFASYVYREYVKEFTQKEIQIDPEWDIEDSNARLLDDSEDDDFKRLDKCLDQLSLAEKDLILTYFSEDKIAKIILRKNLAKKLNIKLETLHVRACRIKESLRKCMEERLEK